MSGVRVFKCPSCGNNLEFSPGQGHLVCPFCSCMVQIPEDDNTRTSAREAAESGGSFRGYHCQNCGAEIVTGDTTAATRCYFCHSPVVLSDRLEQDYRPDGVIPFRLDRKAAEERFVSYLRRKKFLDRRFLTEDQRESITGVYYPYWIGHLQGEAVFSGEGTRVSSHSTSREAIQETRYYRVEREGVLDFRFMQRKALKSTDRKLSDGIHPYTLSEMEFFRPEYLSGFQAEKRDIGQADAEADMVREAEGYAPGLMEAGTTFSSLRGKTRFHLTNSGMRYVLLPSWVLTYRGHRIEEPFHYMMNGQTGTVCGKLPVDKKKLAFFSLILGALVAGLLCLGGVYLW